jgi:hypothetical protein
MTADFQSLCKSLMHCIDTGNKEAEESVLCRIRVALREAEQGTEAPDPNHLGRMMR